MCRVCDIFDETTDKLSVSLWLVSIVARLPISDSPMFKEGRIDSMSITRVMII